MTQRFQCENCKLIIEAEAEIGRGLLCPNCSNTLALVDAITNSDSESCLKTSLAESVSDQSGLGDPAVPTDPGNANEAQGAAVRPREILTEKGSDRLAGRERQPRPLAKTVLLGCVATLSISYAFWAGLAFFRGNQSRSRTIESPPVTAANVEPKNDPSHSAISSSETNTALAQVKPTERTSSPELMADKETANVPFNAQSPAVEPASSVDSNPQILTPNLGDTIELLKAATVFIRVDTNEGLATGSGFLLESAEGKGLLVTNAHVVAPEGLLVKKIECVFHSGTKAEFVETGKVVGLDTSSDLALVGVNNDSLPRAIDSETSVTLHETSPIFILGFPFGEILKTSSRNPAITVSRGIVSSIRRDDYDNISLIQTDGGINPGNSGGPMVTEQGQLIGVSVAKIRGADIGFAIPHWLLKEMLLGRPVGSTVRKSQQSRTEDAYRVNVDFVDPKSNIVSASVISFQKNKQLLQRPEADGRWACAADDIVTTSLAITDASGVATITLDKRSSEMFYQIRWDRKDGSSFYSEPARLVDDGGNSVGATEATQPSVPATDFVNEQILDLPAAYSDFVVAGGGKYVVFNMSWIQKLVVVDVAKRAIVKTLSVNEEGLLAGGMSKIVFVSPSLSVIQRWDLYTFEREQISTFDLELPASVVAMGAASEGPIFIGGAEGEDGHFKLFDLTTLKPIPLLLDNGRMGRGFDFDSHTSVRASADGRVFTSWSSGMCILNVRGENASTYGNHESISYAAPNVNGSRIYSPNGVHSNEGKLLGFGSGQFVLAPAASGSYYVRIQLDADWPDTEAPLQPSVGIWVDGRNTPLLAIPKIDLRGDQPKNVPLKDELTLDRRICFIPDEQVLIALPTTNDVVSFVDLDLKSKLANLGFGEYLYVASPNPDPYVTVGQKYQNRLAVESSRGDLMFNVSGPPGMAVDGDGLVTWTPSKENEGNHQAVVSITDGAGREVLNTFDIVVSVRGQPLPGLEPTTREQTRVVAPLKGEVSKILVKKLDGPWSKNIEGLHVAAFDVDVAELFPVLVWSRDGSHLITSTKTGLVRKFEVPSLKEVQRKNLNAECTSLALSKEGIVVCIQNPAGEICVLDEDSLDVRKRFEVERVKYVRCSPQSSKAYWGGTGVFTLDLESGEVKTQQIEFAPGVGRTSKWSGVSGFSVSSDGNFLYSTHDFHGQQGLQRVRIDGERFIVEELGPLIARGNGVLATSTSGRLVGLRSTRVSTVDSEFPSAVYVYDSQDLRVPRLGIDNGSFNTCMAFDDVTRKVLLATEQSPLIVVDGSGNKLLHLSKLNGKRAATSLIQPNPTGGRLCVLTEEELLWVDLTNVQTTDQFVPITQFQTEASETLPDIAWSADGMHLFTCEPDGLLRKYSISERREVAQMDLKRAVSHISRSKLGLLVCFRFDQRIALVDEELLTITREVAVARTSPADRSELKACGNMQNSMVFVANGETLISIDMSDGSSEKVSIESDLVKPVSRPIDNFYFNQLKATSDGKYLFAYSKPPYALHRLRVAGRSVFMEEQGLTHLHADARRLHEICLSEDSRLVSLPIGGTIEDENHPDVGTGAYIYSVNDLQKPVVSIYSNEKNARWELPIVRVSIDLPGKRVYTSEGSLLKVFGFDGAQENEFDLGPNFYGKQIFVHPDGHRLCVPGRGSICWIDFRVPKPSSRDTPISP